MTLDEMEQIGERAAAIRHAKARLVEARQVLALVNQYCKGKKVWNPELCLKRAEQYSHTRDITIRVEIPFGVVQQQAVYAVAKIEREIVALGGIP